MPAIRRWRLQAASTRRAAVRDALTAADFHGLEHVADDIADHYAAYREANMYLYPDAIDVIDHFRGRGIKLCLVTNGAAEVQYAKIDRFGLRHRFDHIQVEEEAGFGKPDGRAYVDTLAALQIAPEDAMMIGDDLVWDVLAPKRLGMKGIWCNRLRAPLPPEAGVTPDLEITTLSQLPKSI
ncbi:HAD family hydrolase [Arsenicitalea aurantiaca]|uniref:HAD family hydrolase n=1 Tax=Arsenicitalea aurantiaca TaxID=1783274 RepID=UPI0013152C24|nr:HAD family hydrolase [Arsenicitalea aurantiaca]